MSDSQERPWSDNPNAPKIPYNLYFDEKAYFAGTFVGSILYGIVVVLFFKCIAALFNPVYRGGERIKWGLLSYTAVAFSIVTVGTAVYLNTRSISYLNNREFPGVEGTLPPGPLAYQLFITPGAFGTVPLVSSTLNNWLADGLLLYRCYVIYSKNIWFIALPSLMYLGSMAMGITFAYQSSELNGNPWSALPYFSISLSLNVLLTLMIAIRLILHARSNCKAMGISRIDGLSKTIVTMLVESCALYAVSSLLVIGPWSAGKNPIMNFFMPIRPQAQVIAPLLVIQRVADKSALTSDAVVSGRISDFEVRSRGELTGGSGALSSGCPASPVDQYGINSYELRVKIGTTIDLHRDKA